MDQHPWPIGKVTGVVSIFLRNMKKGDLYTAETTCVEYTDRYALLSDFMCPYSYSGRRPLTLPVEKSI